jgi:hypothetical protein
MNANVTFRGPAYLLIKPTCAFTTWTDRIKAAGFKGRIPAAIVLAREGQLSQLRTTVGGQNCQHLVHTGQSRAQQIAETVVDTSHHEYRDYRPRRHGKTTLVDSMIRQSGAFCANETLVDRVMGSKRAREAGDSRARTHLHDSLTPHKQATAGLKRW